MIVSAFGFRDILGTPDVSLDPSRIAAQIDRRDRIDTPSVLRHKRRTMFSLATCCCCLDCTGASLAQGCVAVACS